MRTIFIISRINFTLTLVYFGIVLGILVKLCLIVMVAGIAIAKTTVTQCRIISWIIMKV